VDLPEPDGPITTTTSPRLTDIEMSRRTWNSPNHLLTRSISITFSPPAGASARTAVLKAASVIVVLPESHAAAAPLRPWLRRSPFANAQLALGLPRGHAHAVGEEEVDDRDEQEHLELNATGDEQRLWLHGDQVRDLEEVDEADDEHQ